VEGKLRKKRRQGNIGFDDSDEDEDEDEKAARIRRKIAKKRRIGEDLDKFGENEKTRPFLEAYKKTFEDDDDEFGYLMVEDNANATALKPSFEVDDYESDEAEPRVISSREIQNQILRAAQEGKLRQDTMNPHDTSWIDKEHDELGDVPMEVKDVLRPVARRQDGSEPASSSRGFDRERLQGQSWLKSMNQSTRGGTGRSGLMSAVTGHGKKAKSGGGSLRQPGNKSTLATSSVSAGPARGKPAKASSLLVGLQRRGFE
jgi:mediator of replication checkpoint protein 1